MVVALGPTTHGLAAAAEEARREHLATTLPFVEFVEKTGSVCGRRPRGQAARLWRLTQLGGRWGHDLLPAATAALRRAEAEEELKAALHEGTVQTDPDGTIGDAARRRRFLVRPPPSRPERAAKRPVLHVAVKEDAPAPAEAVAPAGPVPGGNQTSRCLHGAVVLCAARSGRAPEHLSEILAKFEAGLWWRPSRGRRQQSNAASAAPPRPAFG